jgi:8-oxo-dGTP diphosphatase
MRPAAFWVNVRRQVRDRVETRLLAPRTNPARGAPPHRLSVLLVRRPEGVGGPRWALPGTFVHQGERLADAVTRSLIEKAGVTGGHPAQLAVFDAPDRDERGWVLSVAHLAVIPYAALVDALLAHPDRVLLAPVSRLEPLPYDHKAIVVRSSQRAKDTVCRPPRSRATPGPTVHHPRAA